MIELLPPDPSHSGYHYLGLQKGLDILITKIWWDVPSKSWCNSAGYFSAKVMHDREWQYICEANHSDPENF